jgi:hypothetical protein
LACCLRNIEFDSTIVCEDVLVSDVLEAPVAAFRNNIVSTLDAFTSATLNGNLREKVLVSFRMPP